MIYRALCSLSYGRGVWKRDARFGAGLEDSFSSFWGDFSCCINPQMSDGKWRGGCRGSLSCRGSLCCRGSLWGDDSRNTRIPYSWNFSLVPDYKNILQCHVFQKSHAVFYILQNIPMVLLKFLLFIRPSLQPTRYTPHHIPVLLAPLTTSHTLLDIYFVLYSVRIGEQANKSTAQASPSTAADDASRCLQTPADHFVRRRLNE